MTKSEAKKIFKKFSKTAKGEIEDVSKNLSKRLSKVKLPSKLNFR